MTRERAWLLALIGAVAACSSTTTTFLTDDGGADAAKTSEAGTPQDGGGNGFGDATVADTGSPQGDDGPVTGDDGGGGQPDSSSGPDGSGSGDAGEAGPTSDAGDGGTAVPDCGSIPTLHPTDAGEVYCGFGDAGSIYCGVGEQCCLGGSLGNGQFAPEQCAAFGTTCQNPPPTDAGAGGIAIECMQPSDCTANDGGTVCCLRANPPAVVAGCGYSKATGGTGVFCEQATACAAGESRLCESQADCPSGQTCTPFKWKLYQMGFCQ
jgi:hypothetical protein